MSKDHQKPDKWYWPTILDIEGAIAASNKGVWAAGIVSVLTIIAGAVSMFVSLEARGVDSWSFVDALFFGLIAFGIYRRSRVCAILGLGLFVIEKFLQMVAYGLGIPGLAIAGLFFVMFLIGVKGTFAYHRLRSSTNVTELVAE